MFNIDPFIFGYCFLYSNCGQPAQSKKGLKQLGQGSVIAFGGGKEIEGQRKWVLGTVLVVRDSFLYDPLSLREALEGKVPDEFLEVTGGPLVAWAKDFREGSASAVCAPKSERLRLYRGAAPDDSIDEMFGFFERVDVKQTRTGADRSSVARGKWTRLTACRSGPNRGRAPTRSYRKAWLSSDPGSGWKNEDKTITHGGVLSPQAGRVLPYLRS